MTETRSKSMNKIKSALKDKNWDIFEPKSLYESDLDMALDLKILFSADFILVKRSELSERSESLIFVPVKISDHIGCFRFNPEKIRYVAAKKEEGTKNQKIREKIIDEFIKPINEAGNFIKESFEKFSPLAGILFNYLKLDVSVNFDPKNGHFYTIEGKKLIISVKKLILTKNRTEFRLLNEFKQMNKKNPYSDEIEKIINFSPFGFFPRLGIFFAIHKKMGNFLEYIEERESLINGLKGQVKRTETSGDFSFLNILFGFVMFIMGFIDLGIFFVIPQISLSEILFGDAILILITVIIYIFHYFNVKKKFRLENNLNKIKILEPLGLIPEIFFKEFQIFNLQFENILHKFQFIAEHMMFWSSNYQEKTINSNLKHSKILIEEFNNNRDLFEERRNEITHDTFDEIQPYIDNMDTTINYSANLKGLFELIINKKVSLNEINSIDASILINNKMEEAFKNENYNATLELIMLNLLIIFNHALDEKKILPQKYMVLHPRISDVLKEISSRNIFEIDENLITQTEFWENSILDDSKSINRKDIGKIVELYNKIKRLIQSISLTQINSKKTVIPEISGISEETFDTIELHEKSDEKFIVEESKNDKKIYSFNDPKFLSDFLNGNI